MGVQSMRWSVVRRRRSLNLCDSAAIAMTRREKSLLLFSRLLVAVAVVVVGVRVKTSGHHQVCVTRDSLGLGNQLLLLLLMMEIATMIWLVAQARGREKRSERMLFVSR